MYFDYPPNNGMQAFEKEERESLLNQGVSEEDEDL